MPTSRPFRVTVDPAHGGRWTSLVDPVGNEWLWARPDAARDTVKPGDSFVDVGGLEECFPTLSGSPDHGDIWSRSWSTTGPTMSVSSGAARLTRVIHSSAEQVVADYRLDAPPGYRFVWAAHALLMPDHRLRVHVPDGHQVLCWTAHRDRPARTPWPTAPGVKRLDRLDDDDGSATFVLLPRLDSVTVNSPIRGALAFSLECPGQPVAIGLWRNLGGFPLQGKSYRSFGVEPMIGHVPDLSRAGPGESATVPGAGVLTWRLCITNPST